MANRFGKNKFNSRNGTNERKQNTREERKIKGILPLLTVSFKDMDFNQCPPGQKFADWEEEKLLSDFLNKMISINQKTIIEVQQEEILTIYNDFPDHSDFKIPKHIQGDVKWAAIKDIGGQKPRVAGYILDNVFYVVFLDKGHVFFKMKNK